MITKRLTRPGSRERTARRLLDAAERQFARRGLVATSVEDIAAAAGYSRGAFYSNFKGKEDLFLEVLRRDQERTGTRFGGLLNEALPLEQYHARLGQLYSSLFGNPNSFLTWTEGRMLSARDARFRAKLAALVLQRRDLAVKLIDDMYARAGGTPNLPLERMAMGLISLIEGVRLLVASCPDEMTHDGAEAILRLFVDSAVSQAGLATGNT